MLQYRWKPNLAFFQIGENPYTFVPSKTIKKSAGIQDNWRQQLVWFETISDFSGKFEKIKSKFYHKTIRLFMRLHPITKYAVNCIVFRTFSYRFVLKHQLICNVNGFCIHNISTSAVIRPSVYLKVIVIACLALLKTSFS